MQRDNFIIITGTIISLYDQSPNLLIHFGNMETSEIFGIEMPISHEFLQDINHQGKAVMFDFDDVVFKYYILNKDKSIRYDHKDVILNANWESEKLYSFLKPFLRQDKINSILDGEE